jgi:hypothetical protein
MMTMMVAVFVHGKHSCVISTPFDACYVINGRQQNYACSFYVNGQFDKQCTCGLARSILTLHFLFYTRIVPVRCYGLENICNVTNFMSLYCVRKFSILRN